MLACVAGGISASKCCIVLAAELREEWVQVNLKSTAKKVPRVQESRQLRRLQIYMWGRPYKVPNNLTRKWNIDRNNFVLSNWKRKQKKWRKMTYSSCHECGTKNKSESLRRFKPLLTLQSNLWATPELMITYNRPFTWPLLISFINGTRGTGSLLSRKGNFHDDDNWLQPPEFI